MKAIKLEVATGNDPLASFTVAVAPYVRTGLNEVAIQHDEGCPCSIGGELEGVLTACTCEILWVTILQQ